LRPGGRPFAGALLLVALAALAAAGPAYAAAIALTEQDNGGFVLLPVGERLNLSLGGSPSTGYGWHIVELDRSVAEEAASSFESPAPVPGAGGWSNWTFEGKKDGETTLRLEYSRSWERSANPVRRFSVHIVVGTGNTALNLSFLAALIPGALVAAELARRRREGAAPQGPIWQAQEAAPGGGPGLAGRLLHPRTAGGLGLAGIAAMAAGMAGSLALDPRFSLWDSNVSELGVTAGAAFFNWGLLACGVLGAFLASGALYHLSAGSNLRRAGFAVLAAAMAALAAIGVLTEAFETVHFYTAVAFFALFAVASLALGLSLAQDSTLRWPGRLAVFSAVMGVAAWFLPGEGWAISELAAAVPGMLWLGLLAFMMAREKTANRGAGEPGNR
jgi:hypothetical membrane protein/predicted secreted protein